MPSPMTRSMTGFLGVLLCSLGLACEAAFLRWHAAPDVATA